MSENFLWCPFTWSIGLIRPSQRFRSKKRLQFLDLRLDKGRKILIPKLRNIGFVVGRIFAFARQRKCVHVKFSSWY
jgi:hypothetical protein